MDDLLLEYEGTRPATPTERARRRRLAATLTICGLAFVGIGQLSTGAWFSDSGNANLQFTTGAVQVQLAGDAAAVASRHNSRNLTLKSVNNMAPGDTKFFAIDVQNVGSLQMRYSLTGVSTDTATPNGGKLSDQLTYTVYAVDTANCNKAGVATASALASDKIGTATTKLFGDSAIGAQAGDRTVDPAADEWLCVQADLPGPTTDNTYAQSTVDVTLTFDANQVKNT